MAADRFATDYSFYRVFSSGMVLQRNQPVKFAGLATPNHSVQIEFGGETQLALADGNGEWLVEFPPRPATLQAQTVVFANAKNCNNLFRNNLQSGYKKRDTTQYSISLFYCQISCCGMFLWSFCGIFPTATDFDFISQKYPRIRVIRRYLELTRSIIPFGLCNGFSAKRKVVSR